MLHLALNFICAHAVSSVILSSLFPAFSSFLSLFHPTHLSETCGALTEEDGGILASFARWINRETANSFFGGPHILLQDKELSFSQLTQNIYAKDDNWKSYEM